ncbi:MAG: RES family NAD+ phosphorylase [Ginsengibacter sp.]
MIVYRISLAEYSKKLIASGNPARWNSKDTKIIYTAESKALACLENVVHRNSKGLQRNFRQMNIEIPDEIQIEEIKITGLKTDWKELIRISYTQSIGDKWIKVGKTAVSKVPSAIVPGDSNFLLNPAHKDFKKIKLLKTLPFEFGSRIKM